MKELLKEYYQINIDYYREIDGSILFCVDGIYYMFCKIEYDENYLRELNKIVEEVKHMKIHLHEFVYNINGNFKSEDYVLLKINVLNYDVDINDVENFMIEINNEYYKNYVLLEDRLEEKIEFMESENLDYYSSIYEIIISNLRQYFFDGKLVLSHRIFKLNSYDFYNPLNICIDLYWRDIAYYIRLKNDSNLLFRYLNNFSSGIYEYHYFFSRMVLPFDYEYNDDYENYLKEMELLFNLKYFMWLKKE